MVSLRHQAVMILAGAVLLGSEGCPMGWMNAAEMDPRSLKETPSTNVLTMTFDELLEVNVDRVYSASKYDQSVAVAPASVSIVTADEIKRLGYRTLSEALNGVRGIYTSYDRSYTYLGIRGFNRPGDYNTRVLLLVDGHRINEPVYGGAQIGTEFPLDMDQVERIEVVRGPGSSIYGDHAFFGVVNVITRTGSQVNGVEASGEYGHWDAYKGILTYGKRWTNGWDLLLSGSYYESAGPEDLYYPEFAFLGNNLGVSEDNDHDQTKHLFLKIINYGLTLEGGYSYREKGIPTAPWETAFNDPRTRDIDERPYADLKFQHEFANDWALTARTYFDYYRYQGDFPYLAYEQPPYSYLNRDDAKGMEWGLDLQWVKGIADRHKLLFGMEYRNLFEIYQRNADLDPRHEYFSSDEPSQNVGLFAQAEVALRTNLVLNAGARFDYYDSFGGEVHPRIGVVYQASENTTLKLLYGSAFRAPNAFERFYAGEGYTTNPGLDPETISTYELAWEQKLPAHLHGTVSFYYYDIDRLISQTEDSAGNIVYQNAESIQAYGLETGLENRFGQGGLARISYALQTAEETENDTELSNSPQHLIKASLVAPLYRDKIYSGLEMVYQSAVWTQHWRRADDFVVVNWTLFSQKLLKNLEVSASIYNLFDTDYASPGASEHLQEMIAQDGRGFRVKITYRF